MSSTSYSDGTNHLEQTNECPPLTELKAREQLRYEYQEKLDSLTFRTEDSENPERDGIVVAEIDGERVDHYAFKTKQDNTRGKIVKNRDTEKMPVIKEKSSRIQNDAPHPITAIFLTLASIPVASHILNSNVTTIQMLSGLILLMLGSPGLVMLGYGLFDAGKRHESIINIITGGLYFIAYTACGVVFSILGLVLLVA